MGWILRVAFFVVPVAELLVFVLVQDRIGLGWALLAILLTALIGASLVRRQGMAVWASLRQDLAMGNPPARQIVHGAFILVGGALLLTPGFLTDGVGFLLMVPWVREALFRLGSRFWQGRSNIIIP